jgi:hypothetical protein
VAITLLTVALLQAAAGTPCSGYYAYIPRNIESEVAFSVQIQPTAIEVLWTDYGNIFTRRNRQSDGSERFNDGQGGPFYRLICDATGASLSVEASDEGPSRTYRLVRSRTNIWGVARARGWPIGD